MVLCGSLWVLMAPYAATWVNVVLNGPLLLSVGSLLLSMGLYEGSMVLSGPLLLSMGSLLLSMGLYEGSMVLNGPLLLSMGSLLLSMSF